MNVARRGVHGPLPTTRRSGLAWDWAEAARGALSALPGVILVLAGQTGLGLFCAIGVLPVAMLGVPRTRAAATRLIAVGALFAVAYALGSLIGTVPVVAVVVLTVAAYSATLSMTRSPMARLTAALLVPALALGVNEPPAAGFALAGVFAAGSVWATAVGVAANRLWPEPAVAAPSPPPPTPPAFALHTYAVCFAAAAGIGLSLGYLLDVSHEGWIAAAAMFIMRPAPDQSRARAIQRLVATFAGVLLAGVVTRGDPSDVVLAAIALGAMAAVVATRGSRWYVSAFGSGLIVLLISGVDGTADFEMSFRDRLLETAIGAGLAVVLGLAAGILTREHAEASAAP